MCREFSEENYRDNEQEPNEQAIVDLANYNHVQWDYHQISGHSCQYHY